MAIGGGEKEGGITMLVEKWMEKSVITANANDSMLDAINLLKQNDIR